MFFAQMYFYCLCVNYFTLVQHPNKNNSVNAKCKAEKTDLASHVEISLKFLVLYGCVYLNIII